MADLLPKRDAIRDETTSREIEEAIAHVLATARRLPGVPGYQERAHQRIDALLDDWCCARLREGLTHEPECDAVEPDG